MDNRYDSPQQEKIAKYVLNKHRVALDALAHPTMTTTPSELVTQWLEIAAEDAGDGWNAAHRVCATELAAALAASGEAVDVTVCCDRKECGGECGNEWQGMKTAYAAPQPASVADGWRDIESAPEDGVELLCYVPRVGVAACLWYGGRWYDRQSSVQRPTHWQPLPPPPPGARGA